MANCYMEFEQGSVAYQIHCLRRLYKLNLDYGNTSGWFFEIQISNPRLVCKHISGVDLSLYMKFGICLQLSLKCFLVGINAGMQHLNH